MAPGSKSPSAAGSPKNKAPSAAGSPKSKTPSSAGSPQNPGSPSAAGSPQNPDANAPLAIDENVDETYNEDDNASSSASITSSILKYRHENGRTYHAYKDGAYMYPNDDTENERLDLQHNMFYVTFDGRLFLAPVDTDKLHRVLDCGTGTGAWAIDFADDHPEAEVIGVDLSPTQPSFVPPNVRFFIDDLEDTWTYSHKFDFIYSRMLVGSIANWKNYFQQAYDNLAPGGYFEVADMVPPYHSDDGTYNEDCAMWKWHAYALEASYKYGKPLDDTKHHAKVMEEVGFTNVVEEKFKWPTNKWPKDKKYKELGIWMQENVGRNVSAITIAPFTRFLGWSVEEVEVFLIDVRKELKDPNIHAYAVISVVYGQKPFDT